MNQNLFKEDALKAVQDIVKDKGFKPHLKKPDVCFVFEVLKSNCCISILPNYFELKKYNLIELAQVPSAEPQVKPPPPIETTTADATLPPPDQDQKHPATSEESNSNNEEQKFDQSGSCNNPGSGKSHEREISKVVKQSNPRFV